MTTKLLVLIFVFLESNSQLVLKTKSQINLSINYEKVNFSVTPPRELIELLKNNKGNAHVNYFRYDNNAPDDWISHDDIVFLIPLIRSNDSCKCLISPLSSQMVHNPTSTIGGLALSMIDSYRYQTPFPKSFFNCPRVDLERVKDIENWWKEQK